MTFKLVKVSDFPDMKFFKVCFLFSVKNLNMGYVKPRGGLFHIGVVRAVSIF